MEPVLLCGYPKSGTTLLLALLDHHPDLLVFPEESRFFTQMLDPPSTRLNTPLRIRGRMPFVLGKLPGIPATEIIVLLITSSTSAWFMTSGTKARKHLMTFWKARFWPMDKLRIRPIKNSGSRNRR